MVTGPLHDREPGPLERQVTARLDELAQTLHGLQRERDLLVQVLRRLRAGESDAAVEAWAEWRGR